jgi:hypothetical protein
VQIAATDVDHEGECGLCGGDAGEILARVPTPCRRIFAFGSGDYIRQRSSVELDENPFTN